MKKSLMIHTTMCLSIITLTIGIHLVFAMPQQMPNNHIVVELGTCLTNITVQDTCQRCAKITKSPVVYPYCCKDEENTYSWCIKYVYFGIRAKRTDKKVPLKSNLNHENYFVKTLIHEPYHRYELTSNEI